MRSWHPWASVSPSEGRDSREMGVGLRRLALGPACEGRPLSSRWGASTPRHSCQARQARGWAEASPPSHAVWVWLWPPHSTASLSSNVPSSVPPPDLCPSHTASDKARTAAQRSPAPQPRPLDKFKGFKGTSSPKNRGSCCLRASGCSSPSRSALSPPKGSSLARSWLRFIFKGVKCAHREEKD